MDRFDPAGTVAASVPFVDHNLFERPRSQTKPSPASEYQQAARLASLFQRRHDFA